MSIKSDKCLLCNNINHKSLYIINEFNIKKCISCGLVRVDPLPNDEILEKYYRNFDYSDGFINELSIRKDAIHILRQLDKLNIKKGVILDVGCGAGFFMDEARKRKWNVFGIDTSAKAIKYARNVLRLKVIKNDFLTYNFYDQKYDVIILSQLIEHLKNPEDFLNKAYSLLYSKGVLVVITPNINSNLSKILKDRFNYLIPPEHLYYYSPKTLKELVKKCNFNVLKIKTYGYSTDLAIVIKKLFGKEVGRESGDIKIEKLRITLHSKSFIKRFKYIIFDKIFCKIFYPILNFNLGGSMIELYATKK